MLLSTTHVLLGTGGVRSPGTLEATAGACQLYITELEKRGRGPCGIW